MSYIVSIATKKGILLCAESRANFYNERNQPVAYYDLAEKIFIVNDRLAIGTINNEFIDGKLVSASLGRFINQQKNKLTLRNILDRLDIFLEQEFINDSKIHNQIFYIISAQYGTPVVIVKSGNVSTQFTGYGVISPYIGTSYEKNANKVADLKQVDVIRLAEKIITNFGENYVYKDGVKAWKRVGGPIDMIWLPTNPEHKARWIRKKRTHGFKDIHAFLKWVKLNKSAIHPVSPFDRRELDRIIRKISEQVQ